MTEETPPLIEGEDYYMDGPYLVFTEAYHRKRGYCCNSGCRHCPWREAEQGLKDQARGVGPPVMRCRDPHPGFK